MPAKYSTTMTAAAMRLKVIMDFQDPRVAIIDLSRNFGKEIALNAGLDHVRGEAVIVIDADLQDPPDLIPQLIEKWHEGYDVVYARRTERNGESFLKKASAKMFYRIIQGVSRVKIPEDTGDFRLLSRRAVESLKQLSRPGSFSDSESLHHKKSGSDNQYGMCSFKGYLPVG